MIKRLLFGLALAAAFPVYLIFRFTSLFMDRESALQGPSQLMSLFPGRTGNYLRTGFYAMALRRCSPECSISFGTVFSTPECEIGRHVYIGVGCVISDSVIGNDVLIGSHVHVISGKRAHGFERSETPIRLQSISRGRIRIGDNSWIGNGAIVMADVGNGAVIGAGSVVTRDIPDDCIAAGNPARVIRQR